MFKRGEGVVFVDFRELAEADGFEEWLVVGIAFVGSLAVAGVQVADQLG